MNVLLLNAVDNSGGAARAARRLCSSLLGSGVNAEMLVQRKVGAAPFVRGPSSGCEDFFAQLRPHLDAFPLYLYKSRKRYIFSPSYLPESVAEKVLTATPDLVHLHWVCEGFIRIETLARLGKPLVWTLHDSWPFTGGCHVPFDCRRYVNECGCCPSLGSRNHYDLSHWIWKRKRDVFPVLNVTFVAPSTSMAERAMASSLLEGKRVEIIPNGIDTSIFRPMGKDKARYELSLSREKKLILFNALGGYDDLNKGFSSLTSVLDSFREQGIATELLVVGQDKPPTNMSGDMHILGRVESEETMALIYSAADVTVIPSLEENLCFTAMESMACGTPCVAFRVGGNPDLVEHGVNGFLARPGDIQDFCECLRELLCGDRSRQMAFRARQKIESSFSLHNVTDRYRALYEEILAMPVVGSGCH